MLWAREVRGRRDAPKRARVESGQSMLAEVSEEGKEYGVRGQQSLVSRMRNGQERRVVMIGVDSFAVQYFGCCSRGSMNQRSFT